MSQPEVVAAQFLESSAPSLAGYAASLLLERHPGVIERSTPDALGDWRASLTQRILELSAALDVEEPRLFASRVRWAGRALQAREMAEGDLRSGLVCLRDVLGEELPEGAAIAAGGYLEQALLELDQPLPAGADGLDSDSPNDRLALRYLRWVLEGESRRAVGLIQGFAGAGLDLRTIYLEVLVPAQIEVGEMWHRGELCVAEEHFVTATTERAMAVLSHSAERRPDNGRTVIAAAVAGNGHGLPVRVLADFFEMDGWRAVCLVPGLPPADLAAAVRYFGADLVAISASRTTELKAVRRSVEAVRQAAGREAAILAGGGAFADIPELAFRLGADGHAPTAREAVSLGARLVG